MFIVEGRRVKVVTGRKTQTVNVCTEENRLGEYDYIVRLRPPFVDESTLVRESFMTIPDMINNLQVNYHADIQQHPGQASKASIPSTSRPVQVRQSPTSSGDKDGNDNWEKRATRLVETSIDQLILEFIEFPYTHRVEHSIHCELYRILKSHTIFASSYPMGSYSGQLVHKEWPEYIRRPEKQGRGNFDLAILPPSQLENATFDDFRQGRLRPFAAIEMGLDYKLNHLMQDSAKFENSGISNSYLIHLVRESVTDNFEKLEDYVLNSPFKVAYARVFGNQIRFKFLNDSEIQVHNF